MCCFVRTKSVIPAARNGGRGRTGEEGLSLYSHLVSLYSEGSKQPGRRWILCCGNIKAQGVNEVQTTATAATVPVVRKKGLGKRMLNHWQIYLLLLPVLIYFIVFKLFPLWGLQIAFQDYNPYDSSKNVWVGLKYFRELFGSRVFTQMLRNTLVINLMNILFYFPLPILLSVALSEIRFNKYKRVAQSLVYLPHFLSWVVVASFSFFLLSMDVGVINKVLMQVTGEQV